MLRIFNQNFSSIIFIFMKKSEYSYPITQSYNFVIKYQIYKTVSIIRLVDGKL